MILKFMISQKKLGYQVTPLSCIKALNGDIPVPGPIMIMGSEGSWGNLKSGFGDMNTGTCPPISDNTNFKYTCITYLRFYYYPEHV